MYKPLLHGIMTLLCKIQAGLRHITPGLHGFKIKYLLRSRLLFRANGIMTFAYAEFKPDCNAIRKQIGGNHMLKEGTKAPAFSLPDQNGKLHNLEDYRGQKVILYFYPKDNTPGCTNQACNFGELYPQFQEKNAVVLGVSKDSVASHKKFEEKYNLPFTLLSDPGLSCIQAYDVWQEKKNYGKVSMGVVRTTYLIDEEGVIIKAFGKVKAAENPTQMLNELNK